MLRHWKVVDQVLHVRRLAPAMLALSGILPWCGPTGTAVEVEHPFVLREKQDIAEIRRLVRAEAWTRAAHRHGWRTAI